MIQFDQYFATGLKLLVRIVQISIDRHGAQVGKTWAYHPIADAWPMHSDRLGGVKDVFFKVYPP